MEVYFPPARANKLIPVYGFERKLNMRTENADVATLEHEESGLWARTRFRYSVFFSLLTSA